MSGLAAFRAALADLRPIYRAGAEAVAEAEAAARRQRIIDDLRIRAGADPSRTAPR